MLVALRDALRRLGRRDHSEAQLRAALAVRHPEADVDAVITHLKSKRLLDELRAARAIVSQELARRPASAAALRRTLEKRQFPSATIEAALTDLAPAPAAPETDFDRARRALLSRRNLRRDDASRRRALAFLARRGFDEDTARAAVELHLGPPAADDSPAPD